ncbi:unnamed protein product [Thelazia callipaeda]|uniref:Vesicle transport protein USE1 n=1 Tax=Thelazia callipaeda TaxID=103827 RepID=A0A0N5D436_THECL|nr:unnamed protein product [Thelazia callipaeda]
MGTITADEVNFQHLIASCERLCVEDTSLNIFKLAANLKELEEIFGRLLQSRDIDRDILQHYEQSLNVLRLHVEAKQEKTTTTSDGKDSLVQCDVDLNDVKNDVVFSKAKMKIAHEADLRMQLFGEAEKSSLLDSDFNPELITRRETEKQENLANELFSMARLMKHTYSTANAVIKEDNATLSRLQQVADAHKGSLLKESKRLEEYAYRSWCDCLYIVGVCGIIMSFIAMVIIMRVFTKKY